MSRIIEKQKGWDELYEDKKLQNKIRKYRDPNDKNTNFVLESRFKLFEESLNKTKFGSDEFNALLEECVNLYMQLNEEKDLDKDTILKMTKDRLLQNEIVGEFDGKKLKQDKDWPFMGRITLKDAISRKDIGQNPAAKESENVKRVFGGSSKNSSYPSPSSD